jgi:two-component system sensor histidine kinase EvgS
LIIRVPVRNDLEGLKKVSSGELDAAASDLATASYMIELSGITNLRIAAETGMDYHLCFGVNRENSILASIMIKAVNSVTEEESRQIRQKWVHLEFEPFSFSRKLWIAIAVLIAIVAAGSGVFLIWNRFLSMKVDQKTRELSEYRDKLELLVEDRTKELQDTVKELNKALDNVRSLRGLLPICSKCKKIRDDDGYWQQMEEYIRSHSDVEFSHSLCPVCSSELYGDQNWFKKKR